ncbi:MAG: hypothetical protein FWD47_14010 [Treponema sp.]|nr:hypothetical protein [Treponema sp.]
MKNKMFSLVGILVITLVFGMTVVGCVMMQTLVASAHEREQERQGGIIRIQNHGLYHSRYMFFAIYKDSTNVTPEGIARGIRNGSHYDYFPKENGQYTIYYWHDAEITSSYIIFDPRLESTITSKNNRTISFNRGQVKEINIGY